MLDEIRSLGFLNVELSHGIRINLIEGIARALKNDPRLKITSLHNFCPLPVGYFHAAPNLYLFSSDSAAERQRAIVQTLHTMDLAAKVAARYVVLHLGCVFMGDYTGDLLTLIHEGKRDTPQYRKTLDQAIARRKSKGAGPFRRSMKTLEVLVQAAAERQLTLGIESRYRLEEIPSESELIEVFKTFDCPQVAYWHDCGHSQIWHNLGLCDHAQWLQRFQDRLAGSHVHDVAYPQEDHQIPGDGMIPFDQLTALRRPEVIKVFEFEPGLSADALKERLPPFMAGFETGAG